MGSGMGSGMGRFIHLPCLSRYPFLAAHSSTCPFRCLSRCPFFCPFRCLFLSTCPFRCLFLRPFRCPFRCPSLCPSLYRPNSTTSLPSCLRPSPAVCDLPRRSHHRL